MKLRDRRPGEGDFFCRKSKRVLCLKREFIFLNWEKFHFPKVVIQFLLFFLPQTKAGQEEDDLSPSYRQALRAFNYSSRPLTLVTRARGGRREE
jgi:hypothetical protein